MPGRKTLHDGGTALHVGRKALDAGRKALHDGEISDDGEIGIIASLWLGKNELTN